MLALKLFLHFARTGRLDMARQTTRGPDSVLEEQIGQALPDRGYQVHPQVGIARFFIDLAIADPAHPERYLLTSSPMVPPITAPARHATATVSARRACETKDGPQHPAVTKHTSSPAATLDALETGASTCTGSSRGGANGTVGPADTRCQRCSTLAQMPSRRAITDPGVRPVIISAINRPSSSDGCSRRRLLDSFTSIRSA